MPKPPRPTLKQTKARKDNTRAVIAPDKVSGTRVNVGGMERLLGVPMQIEQTYDEMFQDAVARQMYVRAMAANAATAQRTRTSFDRPAATAQQWKSALPSWW